MLTDIFDACSELGSNVNVVPPACASRRGVPLGWSINDILLRKTLYGHAQPPLVNGHRMSVHKTIRVWTDTTLSRWRLLQNRTAMFRIFAPDIG